MLQNLESMTGVILSTDVVKFTEDSAKNLIWSWKEWSTTTGHSNSSTFDRTENLSTVDNSEILYDFGYFDKNLIDCTDDASPQSTDGMSTTMTFSSPSPSTFSSTTSPSTSLSSDSGNDDVEMTSILSTFCSSTIQDAEKTTIVSSIESTNFVEKTSKRLKASPGKGFKCSVCEKTFLSRHYLRFHVASVHQKQRTSACTHCGKLFTGEYYLKQVPMCREYQPNLLRCRDRDVHIVSYAGFEPTTFKHKSPPITTR